jgi:hypothetical protein
MALDPGNNESAALAGVVIWLSSVCTCNLKWCDEAKHSIATKSVHGQ